MVKVRPSNAKGAATQSSSAPCPRYVISSCRIAGPISTNISKSGSRPCPSIERPSSPSGLSWPDTSASLTSLNHLLSGCHRRVHCKRTSPLHLLRKPAVRPSTPESLMRILTGMLSFDSSAVLVSLHIKRSIKTRSWIVVGSSSNDRILASDAIIVR